MGHFYNKNHFDSSLFLEHSANKEHAKYGTANSTTSEKGTDNKLNNSSEYNHEYYEGNKDKWEDNKSTSKSKKKTSTKQSSSRSDNDSLYYDKDGKARFGHKDYDANDEDFKRTDGEKIAGTDLRTFTNKNGSTIIMGKGIKFSFPPGTKITEAMARKIAAIEGGDKSNKESYIAKMLNAVTGFADKQGLNTDAKKKSSGKKSSSKESSSSSSSETKKTRSFDEAKKDYYKKPSQLTEEEKKKRAKELNNAGKKNKGKQNAQYAKHSEDLGSIFVRDLY